MKRALSIAGILAILVALIWLAYALHVPRFVAAGDPKTQQYQPEKTFWDWMQLLIIPAVLAGAAFWFNSQQTKTEHEINTKQREQEQMLANQRWEQEQEIARDHQRENGLQAYLDHMTELLMEENLRDSQEGDEVRQIARIRTLTALRTLDARRNAIVLRFLQEAGLREKEHPIVNLRDSPLYDVALQGADLTRLNLNGLTLRNANLSETNLNEADLSEAKLSEANLRGAILAGADLSGADLRGAILSEADLYDVNLTKALLIEARLSWANLYKANLEREPT